MGGINSANPFGGERALKALKTEPDDFVAQSVLGLAYEQKSMYEPAIAAFQQSAKVSGDSVTANAGLGHVYGVAGKNARPRRHWLN